MTGASADFEGGGQTFGTLNFTGGGNMKIGFSNTFAALSVIGTAVTTDSFSSGGGTNTVTGTFTITGNSGVNTIAVKSDTTASVRNFVFGNGAFSNIASWTDVSLNMNGAGNTWTLSEDLILGGTGTTMTLTITAGTIIAGTKNVSAKLFNSSNSNVRTLTMGSGTWTLTGTGTVWTTATATNLSSDMSTGKLVISDVSSSSKTISAAASASFGTITTTAGGTGAVIFPSNNVTVSTLNVTGPKTLTFTSAKTYTITNWNVNGTYGNPVTINASTPGSAATISIAKGTISSDFLSVKDSTATGGATFYAGSHSTNALGNNGWIFDDAPLTASENAAIDNNSNPTMLGSVTTDPTKTAKLYSDPYVHSLVVSDSTGGTGYGGTSAPRDGNQNTAILAVSSADGVSPVAIYINPNLHELLINSN
jgi:hypothetical protein